MLWCFFLEELGGRGHLGGQQNMCKTTHFLAQHSYRLKTCHTVCKQLCADHFASKCVLITWQTGVFLSLYKQVCPHHDIQGEEWLDDQLPGNPCDTGRGSQAGPISKCELLGITSGTQHLMTSCVKAVIMCWLRLNQAMDFASCTKHTKTHFWKSLEHEQEKAPGPTCSSTAS